MATQFGYPSSLRKLLTKVQEKSNRRYISPDDFCAYEKFHHLVLKNKEVKIVDNKVYKRYQEHSKSIAVEVGTYFDLRFSPIVDQIVDALHHDRPTYTLPADYEVVTKEKILPQPKYSTCSYPMKNSQIVRGERSGNILKPAYYITMLPFNDGLTRVIESTSISDAIFDEMKTAKYMLDMDINKSRDKDNAITKLDAPYKVPVLIFASDQEYSFVKANLGPLAQRGIIVAISKDMFEDLHGKDVQRTRSYVNAMTRHNDKLSVDWFKPGNEYVQSISEQFTESAYKGFVTDAAAFVKAKYPEYSKVLETMSTKFSLPRSQLQKGSSDFYIPKTMYERRVQGVNRKSVMNRAKTRHAEQWGNKASAIDQDRTRTLFTSNNYDQRRHVFDENESQHEEYLRACHNEIDKLNEELVEHMEYKKQVATLQNQLVGYDNSFAINKNDFRRFASEVQRITKRAITVLKDQDMTYPAAVLNPFVNMESRPRIPQVNPEPTLALCVDDELSVSMGANETFLAFGSHACTFSPLQYFKGASDNNVITSLLTKNVLPLHNEYLGTYYRLNQAHTGAEIKVVAGRVVSQALSEFGDKGRVVAAGVKFAKISKQENESGTLIATNHPKGISIGNSQWSTHFERQDKNRAKVYTASQPSGPILGCIYRPQDIYDTTGFYETTYPAYYPHDDSLAGKELQEQHVWYSKEDSPEIRLNQDDLVNGELYYICFNSHFRHVYTMYFTTAQSFQFELNWRRHYECIPRPDQKIHELKEEVLPMAYSDAVHLLRHVQETDVFGQHDELLLNLISQELQTMRVIGVWSETILPMAKDFLRWTKNVAEKSGVSDFLTSRAGDIALTALGTIQPEVAAALKFGIQSLQQTDSNDESSGSMIIQGNNHALDVKLNTVSALAIKKQ